MKRDFWLDLIATCVCMAAAYLIYINTFLDMDVAWHVEGAKRLLSGGNYLSNIFDDNGLYVFAFYFPVIWLHHLLHSHYAALIAAYIIFVNGACLVLCDYIILRVISRYSPSEKHLFYTVIVFSLLFLPLISYGQREMVLVSLLLPYSLLLIFTTQQHSTSILKNSLEGLCAVLASIAILQNCLYLLAIIFVDIYRLTVGETIRRYQIIFYAAIIILAALNYYLYPGYFKTILPLLFCYENGLNASSITMLTSLYGFFCLLSLLLIGFNLKKIYRQPAIIKMTIVVFTSWLIYFFEKKNWYNHIYPALVFTLLLNILVFIKNHRAYPKNLFSLSLAASIMLTVSIIIVGETFLNIKEFYDPHNNWNQWIAFTNMHFKHKKIFYISAEGPLGYVLPVYTQTSTVSPWLNTWFLPSMDQVKQTDRPGLCNVAKDSALVERIFQTSLNKMKPDVVIIWLPTSKQKSTVNSSNFFTAVNLRRQLANYYLYGYFKKAAIYLKRN